jgi:hypothetical protein
MHFIQQQERRALFRAVFGIRPDTLPICGERRIWIVPSGIDCMCAKAFCQFQKKGRLTHLPGPRQDLGAAGAASPSRSTRAWRQKS